MPVGEINTTGNIELTASQISAAAQNANKAANKEVNKGSDLDKAINIVSTAVNYGEKSGKLVARDGLPKHSDYVKNGAVLGVSIARLVATSGADVAAWAAAGKAVANIASDIVKTMQILKDRDNEFELLINTYPVTAWICKNGKLDFQKPLVDCSTGAAHMRGIRDIMTEGAFEALLTRTYLMYAATVRDGDKVEWLEGWTFSQLEKKAKEDFVSKDYLGRTVDLSVNRTVEFLKKNNYIKVDDKGDLLPESLEKFTGLPVRDKNEKINAKVYMACFRQMKGAFIDKTSEYFQMVSAHNLYYSSAVVTGGFYHDIVKKEEMEKVIGIAADAFGTKNNKSNNNNNNNSNNNNNRKKIIIAIAAVALMFLTYYFFLRKK